MDRRLKHNNYARVIRIVQRRFPYGLNWTNKAHRERYVPAKVKKNNELCLKSILSFVTLSIWIVMIVALTNILAGQPRSRGVHIMLFRSCIQRVSVAVHGVIETPGGGMKSGRLEIFVYPSKNEELTRFIDTNVFKFRFEA